MRRGSQGDGPLGSPEPKGPSPWLPRLDLLLHAQVDLATTRLPARLFELIDAE